MAQNAEHLGETTDLDALERALVGARMWLHYQLSPKGDRAARKIFCLGPAKTGTSSLHALFEGNGLASQHSPGNWRVARYEAFSDRGDYRPFRTYARDFPNAVFVLNTRGLRGYLSSHASHLQRRRSGGGTAPLSVQFFVNRILRRNRHMAEVLAHFAGTERLIIANIERAGAMAGVARALGLDSADEIHRHRTERQRHGATEANIDLALDRLGLTGQAAEPLIFPRLLPAELARAAAGGMPAPERCFL
ncbi:MAG: hypothetical protein ACT4N9_03145 [Paracoccaceae bacterium]